MKLPIHPLKLARNQHNLTQKRLAEEAGVGEQTILRAEHYKPINAESRRAICAYFGMTQEDLGLLPARQGRGIKSSLFPPARVVPALPQPSHALVAPVPFVRQERDTIRISADAPYGDLMQALTITGAALAIPEPALLRLPIVHHIKRALVSGPDEMLLLHLEQMTCFCIQLLPKVQGTASRTLLNYVVDRFLLVSELLEYASSQTLRTRLAVVASKLAGVAGEIYFDEKNSDTAYRYFSCAIEAAKIAQHDTLQAMALGYRSFVPIYGHEAAKALPSLAEAHVLAAKNAPALTKSWLWAVEAEAQANLHDESACFKATALLGYRGICALRLHLPEDAEDILLQALASMEPSRLRHKAIVLIDLAATYTQQLEIEEACRCAVHALQIISQIQSSRVLQRLINFRSQLERWRDTPSVRLLDEQIRTLGPFIAHL